MNEQTEPSDEAVELVGMLTRSKTIWKNPELLKLVENTPSPTKAFSVVLRHTGSQRKAKAARWYRMAMRDYGEHSPGALVGILQSPQGAAQLEKLLTDNPNYIPETRDQKGKNDETLR
jgi:hypothetical protein